MTCELFFKAIVRYLSGVVLLGVLLFLPAGTLGFQRGWLFMGGIVHPHVLGRNRLDVEKSRATE